MDTNGWISALLNRMGAPARILRAYLAQETEIISSEPLLEELREVLQPKVFTQVRSYKRDVDSYVELIGDQAIVVEITGQILVAGAHVKDVVLHLWSEERSEAIAYRPAG